MLAHLARASEDVRGAFDPFEKVAVDIKVVSACGMEHARQRGPPCPQRPLDEYEGRVTRLGDKGEVCADHGARYFPASFSA